MRLHVTASGLRRTELCPASAHLPRTERMHDDAEAGTEAHAVLEAEDPANSEIGVAYNVLTSEARLLPRDGHRNYPAFPDNWVYGTADRVRVEAERVVVVDHKTGYGFNVSAAKENLQLGFYALALTAVHGKDSARVEVRYTDGRVDAADLDRMDLDAIGSRIFAVVAAARASSKAEEPRVVEGEVQCWRCPCVARCPAKVAMAVSLSVGIEARRLPTLELTPAVVADGWAKLKAMKQVLGEVERAYRAFASTEPVLLANGKTLGPVEKRRESVDGEIAFGVLKETLGEDVARAACEMSTSKTAIGDAIKSIAKKGSAAGIVRETMTAIELAGGISSKTSTGVEEH